MKSPVGPLMILLSFGISEINGLHMSVGNGTIVGVKENEIHIIYCQDEYNKPNWMSELDSKDTAEVDHTNPNRAYLILRGIYLKNMGKYRCATINNPTIYMQIHVTIIRESEVAKININLQQNNSNYSSGSGDIFVGNTIINPQNATMSDNACNNSSQNASENTNPGGYTDKSASKALSNCIVILVVSLLAMFV